MACVPFRHRTFPRVQFAAGRWDLQGDTVIPPQLGVRSKPPSPGTSACKSRCPSQGGWGCLFSATQVNPRFLGISIPLWYWVPSRGPSLTCGATVLVLDHSNTLKPKMVVSSLRHRGFADQYFGLWLECPVSFPRPLWVTGSRNAHPCPGRKAHLQSFLGERGAMQSMCRSLAGWRAQGMVPNCREHCRGHPDTV